MAPEYALWGYLTPKVDVYSFGVLILEVMAGRSNMKFQPNEEHFCLLDKVNSPSYTLGYLLTATLRMLKN